MNRYSIENFGIYENVDGKLECRAVVGDVVSVRLTNDACLTGVVEELGDNSFKLEEADGYSSWILVSTVSDIADVKSKAAIEAGLEEKAKTKVDRTSAGYKAGAFFTAALSACMTAIIVALTVRFIIWLF